jgi:hypothetical protein
MKEFESPSHAHVSIMKDILNYSQKVKGQAEKSTPTENH